MTTSQNAAATYPDHLRERVESYLVGLRFAREPAASGLEESMRYSLLAGGKRIRPVLALATASAIGRDPGEVLPLAAALELIHTYSLIHDDLPAMDDVRYGDDVAILAGDGLYAEAFRLVLHRQQGDPAAILAALGELADATGVNGMVGGQYIDVKGLVDRGETSLRHLHELKTGRLIGASVECVLLLTEDTLTPSTLPAFRAFAAELGVLFQIVDDILDVTGTEDALGKPQGSDERHGKRTYVSQYGLEGAREMAAASHRSARAALHEAAPDTATELEQITDFIATRSS
jgi:geranylgeranyl diphosphate synthase type II